MDSFLSDFKQSAEKTIENLKEDLKSIRTGRATPAIVENIIVNTYGGQTKLRMMELATITTEGPSILVIAPFDPSTVKDVEKAILTSPLGLNPHVQGTHIKINIPSLSQEQREKFVKIVAQKIEERKQTMRNLRDNGRKEIKQKFEAKEWTEDDKFRFEKELDKIAQTYMELIQDAREKKEKEIMEV